MKLIAMFKRHPSLTPEQFREEYEKVHVPYALKYFPYLKDYRRNYLRRDVEHRRAEGEAAQGLDFDVVTELTFEHPEDYERMRRTMSDPVFQAEVMAHEKRFMDYEATVVLLVDEAVTDMRALAEDGSGR
jgi:hypothetical protein